MESREGVFCGDKTILNTLDNCLKARDSIGEWGTNMTISNGILADDRYKNWAKIIIPNCDGTFFQGYSKNGTLYKNKQLYFRGNKMIKSHLAAAAKAYPLTKF